MECGGAQPAGDRHYDLQRPDVALGSVIREGDAQVGGVAQHFLAVPVEAVEQVHMFGGRYGVMVRAVRVGGPGRWWMSW